MHIYINDDHRNDQNKPKRVKIPMSKRKTRSEPGYGPIFEMLFSGQKQDTTGL